MVTLYFTLTGLFGLVIGSFLNVVIYSLPRHIGFVAGRSVCTHCSNQLRWYHNIPVVSFLVLRGKCGFCKKPISWRYPLVESVNSLLWVFLLLQSGLNWSFVVYCVTASLLIVVFFIDLDFRIIPDVLTLPGIVLGLAVSFLPHGLGFVNSLLGVLVGGGALYLIAILGDWLFKKESMGGGDIKLAAMLGSLVGWQKILLIFMASAVIGIVISGLMMLISARLRQERIVPFGPFLALAALLAMVYGDRIIHFYVHTILALP